MPGRFQQVTGFHDYSVQPQHPCYTTSSRDLGKKKPQVTAISRTTLHVFHF